MSARHCTVEEREGRYTLTDMDSRNGTYIRIKTERALGHGDYVFIGRRLLRVERERRLRPKGRTSAR